MLLVLDGVAVQAQRRDLLPGRRDEVQHPRREVPNLHAVEFHVEADLKALKALVHHVGKILQRLLPRNAGADGNLFHVPMLLSILSNFSPPLYHFLPALQFPAHGGARTRARYAEKGERTMTILRILLAIALLAAIAACGYAAYVLLSSLIGRLLPLFSWLL